MTQGDQPLQTRSPATVLRRLRRLVFLLFCSAALVGAAGIGWFAARARYAPQTLGLMVDDGEWDRDFDSFQRLAGACRTYIVAHDGFLPADPYRALLEAGAVDAFLDFQIGQEFVSFNTFELPPRLNVEMRLNPKHELFSVYYRGPNELWIMNMDGTVERRACGVDLDVMAKNALASSAWSQQFHRAGYPYWESVPDKQKWTDSNKAKLTWDPAYQMYVPTTQPARPGGSGG